MKFTAKSIEALKPRQKEYIEREKHGFAIRVHPSGRMAWLFIYDYAGRRRKMTLGHYPECSLKEARVLYNGARATLDKGKDPAAREIDMKRKLRGAKRVKDLVAEYYENSRFFKGIGLSNAQSPSFARITPPTLPPNDCPRQFPALQIAL